MVSVELRWYMQAEQSALWCAGIGNTSLPCSWKGWEKENVIVRMKLSRFWIIALEIPILTAHGEYHFSRERGNGFWTSSSSSVLEKSVPISSVLIKWHNKTGHQAHLLLMSKMPNPNKSFSCGLPQATGLFQQQDDRRMVFHGSSAGTAVVLGGCSF